MTRFTPKTAALCAVTLGVAAPLPALAQDDAAGSCGEVSITEMNWASASVVTNVATFIMEQGYGCDVSIVPSDTVPAITSVAENGEPDIVTELWVNATGNVYEQLKEEGRVEELGAVLDPGGIDAWWIPDYLAEDIILHDGATARIGPEAVGTAIAARLAALPRLRWVRLEGIAPLGASYQSITAREERAVVAMSALLRLHGRRVFDHEITLSNRRCDLLILVCSTLASTVSGRESRATSRAIPPRYCPV